MKYKAYITDSSKIFWTKNSVDKPTKQFFKYLMEDANWKELGNITPNFINQFNGSITVDKDTYTYLKLVDEETGGEFKVKYFSIDSVNKVLSNGFVLDITLDVFTTYTLNFYYEIENKPIKVNRTSAYCLLKDSIYSQLLKDELIPLPFKPVNYKFKNVLYNTYLTTKDEKDNLQYVYDAYDDRSWSLNYSRKSQTQLKNITIKNKNFGYLYENALFDVFQDVNGDWFFLPILGYNTTQKSSNGATDYRDWLYIETDVDIRVQFVANQYQIISANVFCWNTLPFTNKIKNNTFWANKYVGRYIIPNWVRMIIDFGVPVVVRTNTDVNNVSGKYQLYGCIYMIKVDNRILSTNRVLNQYFDFKHLSTNIINSSSNYLNLYVYSKITQMSDELIFNFNNISRKYNDINYPELGQVGLFINYNVPDKPISLIFNSIKGASWYNPYLPTINKLKSFEVLPSNTNVYSQYIAGVQSQQNTSIELSKQQMFMGMFRSAYSGAAQSLNAVGQMGMNPMFAAGGFTNAIGSTISGIASSIIQYQNTKKQIDAKNADVLRSSTANNINTSDENSNIANSVIGIRTPLNNGRVSLYEFDGIIANGGFEWLNINQYNKIIWECGYLINNVVILNKLKQNYKIDFYDDYVNKFIYWDIEVPIEYVKQTYPNYNNELIEAIATTISNPVRLWKESTPDYNCDLMTGWVNK